MRPYASLASHLSRAVDSLDALDIVVGAQIGTTLGSARRICPVSLSSRQLSRDPFGVSAGADHRRLSQAFSMHTLQLTRARQLWQAYLIEGFGESTAVLWRIHHCMADGIALGRVLLSITDEGGDRGRAGRRAPRQPADARRRIPESLRGPRQAGRRDRARGMESLVHSDHLRELAGAALGASFAARAVQRANDP